MSTGDLRNNLYKLQSKLKKIEFHGYLNSMSLGKGDPESFLPLFHYILLDALPLVADYFASRGYNLYGKKDSRFIECVYKLLRDEFTYKPVITKEQFFSLGFSERKIILTCDIIDMCLELNKKLIRVEYNKGCTLRRSQSCNYNNNTKNRNALKNNISVNYYEYSDKENFHNPINISNEYSSDLKRDYNNEEELLNENDKIYQNELDGVMQYPPSRFLKQSWNDDNNQDKSIDYDQVNEKSNYCESPYNDEFNNTEVTNQNENKSNYKSNYNDIDNINISNSNSELISYIKLLLQSNDEIKTSINSLTERLSKLETKFENSSAYGGSPSQTEHNIMKIKNIIEKEKSITEDNDDFEQKLNPNDINNSVISDNDIVPVNNNGLTNNDVSIIQEQCIAEEVSIDESIPSNTNVSVQKSSYTENGYSNNNLNTLYNDNINMEGNNKDIKNNIETYNHPEMCYTNSKNKYIYDCDKDMDKTNSNNISRHRSGSFSSINSNTKFYSNNKPMLKDQFSESKSKHQSLGKDTLDYLEKVTQNLKETKNIFMGNV